MTKLKILFYTFLISIIASCSSSNKIINVDYTYLYDDSQKLIKPNFKIFHHSSDSSTVYYHLKSNNILYGKVNGDSILKARVWLKYRLFADENRSEIIDSATHKLVNYGANENHKILQGSFRMKTTMGKAYPYEIRFRDENKDLNVVYQLIVDKRNNRNEQFYLLKRDQKVLVDPILQYSDRIQLEKSSLVQQDTFLLQQTNMNYLMTPPPFAEDVKEEPSLQIDSNKQIVFKENTAQLSNFYNINQIAPKDSTKPFYFYYFHEGFPQLTTVEHLIPPIRYISTTSEFKKVNEAINTKEAIDNFWLGLGRNEERAKKMIKEYYSRVEKSNEYFTSYKEGWKTDRGIIYIVYGKPTTIYKTITKEVWIYGEENNILSIKFEFYKINNPKSNNDFRLARSSDYKNNWYRAVDMWRQSKIY